MTATDLPLAVRTGLSDDVAYLRAAYPQSGWRTHANFGDLAGFWLHIHATLRSEAAAVGSILTDLRNDGADRSVLLRRFAVAFNGFLQHLDGHHRIEDGAYFPRFRTLDARMIAGLDLLEADHLLIDRTLHAAVDSARAMMAATGGDDATRALDTHADHLSGLDRLIDRHLADEEDLVIPALLEHGERSLGI